MAEAIIGNVNHLSKSESLHYSCSGSHEPECLSTFIVPPIRNNSRLP